MRLLRWPKFNHTVVANPGWGFHWNDYDYRKYGGSLYRIGVGVVLGKHAYGVRWARPGTDFGRVE